MIAERAAYDRSVATRKPSAFDVDLVVAGRGLVGSATAFAAAQAGLRVALVGRPVAASNGEWDDRVYAIAPAVRAWFEALRLGSRFDASRVAPVRAMRIREGSGPALELTSFAAGVAELAAIVEARELHRVLDLGLAMQPRLSVVDLEIESAAFEATRAGVTGRTSTGTTRAFHAPLVVAADGPDSILRKTAGIEVRERDYAQRGVVARLRLAAPHRGTAFQWFLGAAGVLALLPLPPQGDDDARGSRHASLVWSLDDAEAARLLALDRAGLAREIARACGEADGFVDVLSDPLGFPLRHFVTQSLVAPRLALVGDAAHLMHPLAGQGLNTGLRDAETLVATLSARESFRDLGDLRLLRRYARARAEPVSRMLALTDGLQRLFRLDHPVAGAARAAGMALIEGLSPVKRHLIHQAVASDARPLQELHP